MYIVHFIPNLNIGGAEKFLLTLTQELSLNGFDSTIVVFSLTKTRNILGSRAKVISIFSKDFLRLLLSNKKKRIALYWLAYAQSLSAFTGIFFDKNIWLVRRTSIEFKTLSFKSWVSSMVNIPLSYLIPNSIVYCADVAKTHHESKLYCSKNGLVIHNFVTTHCLKIRDGVKRQKIKCIFVGKDSKAKNVNLLIQIFAALGSRYSCDLYGGDLVDSNRQLVKRMGGNKSLRLMGSVNDLSFRYHEYDCLISTSTTEGFPNAIAEAVASGLPVIATNVGDTAAIVEGSGVLIDNFRLDQFLSAVRHIGSSNFDPRIMHENTQKKFSKEQIVKKYIGLLNV
jgi:glycosyltransferase involved in cell wall biosynthesis